MKNLIEILLEMSKNRALVESKMVEIYQNQETIKNIQKNIRTLNYEVNELKNSIEQDYIKLAIGSGRVINEIKEDDYNSECELEKVLELIEEKLIIK